MNQARPTCRPTAAPRAHRRQDRHAELADAPSHAWFTGYAPYGAGARKVAFSVLVENGVYGGTAAACPGGNRRRRGQTGTDSAMSLFSDIEKTIERCWCRRFACQSAGV